MKYLKVFTDFLDVTAQLGDGALGRLFRAMLRYARDGAEPELKGKEAVAWAVAKQHIDREKDAYEAMVEARRDAGRSGAKARWEKQAEHGKHGQDKDKEKENDKDKDKGKDFSFIQPAAGAGKKETCPSLQEIMEYAQQACLSVDGQHFYDYYVANGWHIGKQPMQDWRAALRAWARNAAAAPRPAPPGEPTVSDNFRKAMEMMRQKEAKQI